LFYLSFADDSTTAIVVGTVSIVVVVVGDVVIGIIIKVSCASTGAVTGIQDTK
jgi:hypothetical protein